MSIGDFMEHADYERNLRHKNDFLNSVVLLQQKLDQAETYGRQFEAKLLALLNEIASIQKETERSFRGADKEPLLAEIRLRAQKIKSRYASNFAAVV